MILEIVSPEATLLHTEVDVVTVPGISGEFQMLIDHAPIVSLLVEGEVKFKGSSIKIKEEFEDKFTKIQEEFVQDIIFGN